MMSFQKLISLNYIIIFQYHKACLNTKMLIIYYTYRLIGIKCLGGRSIIHFYPQFGLLLDLGFLNKGITL